MMLLAIALIFSVVSPVSALTEREVLDKLEDTYTINGAEFKRDIRKCTISFSPLRKNLKKRFLLSAVTDYALNTLNMEEVFISLEKEDLKTLKQLEQNNYENIGEVNGCLIYLKEKNYS